MRYQRDTATPMSKSLSVTVPLVHASVQVGNHFDEPALLASGFATQRLLHLEERALRETEQQLGRTLQERLMRCEREKQLLKDELDEASKLLHGVPSEIADAVGTATVKINEHCQQLQSALDAAEEQRANALRLAEAERSRHAQVAVELAETTEQLRRVEMGQRAHEHVVAELRLVHLQLERERKAAALDFAVLSRSECESFAADRTDLCRHELTRLRVLSELATAHEELKRTFAELRSAEEELAAVNAELQRVQCILAESRLVHAAAITQLQCRQVVSAPASPVALICDCHTVVSRIVGCSTRCRRWSKCAWTCNTWRMRIDCQSRLSKAAGWSCMRC
jgi:hypothetical protein